MALLLTEGDVRELLTMPAAIAAVEESFRRLAAGNAIVHPRQRLHIPGKSYLHYMAAADATGGYMGLKIYSSAKEGLRFIVPLFNVTTGDLAAVIEADFLGQVRTGAASGVATRWMSREDARVVGIIGTGLQARTQLEAVSLVRKVAEVRVCGRDANRREGFAAEMSARLKVPVRSAANAEEAVRDADIVITSTTSTNPVVEGRWLKKGTHINAIGANFPQKRELDAEAIERCEVIAVDSREQSKLESGDLIQVFGHDDKRWNGVAELADIVAGKAPGRTNPEQITLFKSNGIATEDIVVAGQVYELARQRKIGREIPMWEKEARFGEARGV
jgi:alanine dehydrogenase